MASLGLLVSTVGPAAPGTLAQSPPTRPAGSAGSSLEDEARLHVGAAVATQTATRAQLGVLGDAFTCADARFVAYRRSTAERETTDQWYVASQLWADALLLGVPEPPAGWDRADARCYLDKGFVFLDRLWDYTSAGYFPRANPVGTRVESERRFGDDNALSGLALLDAAASAGDPRTAGQYTHAAVREADFLLQSSLWDDTFGGGFWWNTGRGDSPEGKPAQTNAVAALFFARLYAATGTPTYREWALRTLLWLDTILYDPARHLYHWSVAYQDIPARRGSTVSPRLFNYDQGIAIEAQLAAQRLDGDVGRLARARDVGAAIPGAFWSDELGGYNLEAGVQQVFASYAAWTGLGELALFDADGDRRWLDEARRDASGLAAQVRGPDGSYSLRAYACVDRLAPGCDNGQAHSAVDPTVDTAAGAWAQHLETALALRLAPPSPSPSPDAPDAPAGEVATP